MHTPHPPVERDGSLRPAVLAALRRIVGEGHVIAGDADRLAAYAHDEAHGVPRTFLPAAVVKPISAQEIAAIMRLANAERFAVTPRGAGSGLAGGAVPVYGGVVLALERMNRILEVDLANLVAVVEPAVVTNDINDAVRPHGLFYAGYPMSRESCSIGGNVATNAGGGRAIKYGVTGRYVLGLEVVLPTGEIVELGGKRLKDVTGYGLLHLMIGSEGTLGIFTRIILRLLPLPAAQTVLLIPFPDLQRAIAAIPAVLVGGGLLPASVELMDRHTLEAAHSYMGERPPAPQVGAALLVELDGSSRPQVESDAARVAELALQHGALDVFVGDTPTTARRMWRLREKAPEALTALSPDQSSEDVVVPPAAIPELALELERLRAAFGVTIPCFGHAADGNLHLRILKDPGATSDEWEARKPEILQSLYRAVARLGGTISGEHGIGLKRAPYLPLVQSADLIALQRRIKAAFDPHGILNPGKILPENG